MFIWIMPYLEGICIQGISKVTRAEGASSKSRADGVLFCSQEKGGASSAPTVDGLPDAALSATCIARRPSAAETAAATHHQAIQSYVSTYTLIPVNINKIKAWLI